MDRRVSFSSDKASKARPNSAKGGPPPANAQSPARAATPSRPRKAITPKRPPVAAPVAAPGTFEPAKVFAGPKEGFVFKSGANGLGYYLDSAPPPPGRGLQGTIQAIKVQAVGQAQLDPDEVFAELPESLQRAFDNQDIAALDAVLVDMPRAQAEACMLRCIASGLWDLAANLPGDEGDADELEHGDPEDTQAAPANDEQMVERQPTGYLAGGTSSGALSAGDASASAAVAVPKVSNLNGLFDRDSGKAWIHERRKDSPGRLAAAELAAAPAAVPPPSSPPKPAARPAKRQNEPSKIKASPAARRTKSVGEGVIEPQKLQAMTDQLEALAASLKAETAARLSAEDRLRKVEGEMRKEQQARAAAEAQLSQRSAEAAGSPHTGEVAASPAASATEELDQLRDENEELRRKLGLLTELAMLGKGDPPSPVKARPESITVGGGGTPGWYNVAAFKG